MLLEEKDAIGLACDLRALGCMPFELRQQVLLFYMIFDKDELLAEMVRFLGKLPEGLLTCSYKRNSSPPKALPIFAAELPLP